MDKVKKIVITIVETVVITGIVLFSVLPVSCKVSTQGIQIIGGNYKVPQLLDYNVVDENNIILNFSDQVKLYNVIVSPFISQVSDSFEISNSERLSPALEAASGAYGYLDCSVEYVNENKSANILIENGTNTGCKYELYGVVEDKIGNTLTFCIPFVGYNSRIPKLRITEVHPAMAGIQKNEDSNGTRRLEYVEILAETEGNLSGLEFCSGYAGENKAYIFPSIEVREGELIVLHLRTWGEGCISEDDDNLDLAWSRYSGSYRDLWSLNTGKPMGDKNDVLVIKDISSEHLIDAFMYSDSSFSSWAGYLKTDFTQYDDFVNFYDDNGVASAVSSTGIGTTKVFAFDYDSESWIITTPSPGSL